MSSFFKRTIDFFGAALLFVLLLYPIVTFVLLPITHPDLTKLDLLYSSGHDLVAIPCSLVLGITAGLNRRELPKMYTWLFYLSLVGLTILGLHWIYRLTTGW